MAKSLSKATAAIQRLLDERQQIQTWLERLSVAGDSAPEHVRAKVRGDYERRLGEVMKELQVHGGELHATLERLQTSRDGLADQEREAAERVSSIARRMAMLARLDRAVRDWTDRLAYMAARITDDAVEGGDASKATLLH